jgi:hypothetical protein
MNKLTFYLSILKFVLLNPQAGKNLLSSKYQTLQDIKKINSIYNYEDKKSEFNEILDSFFPDSNYSQADFHESVKGLQLHTKSFLERLEKEKYPSKSKPYPVEYTLDNESGEFLYFLCKLLKPDKVVETGVAYGLSSMYILQALHENNKGTLYSIDSVFLPWQSKEMIGAAIPVHLRKNWKLISGPSSKKLKNLLNSLQMIDIFFHDSLHTSKNMRFEFEISWPFIKDKGFLLSDDISSNNAFYEFYARLKLKPKILPQKTNLGSFFGILQKS